MLLRFNDSAQLREWTVQSLINVRTHLVLVSGKLVLQKKHFGDGITQLLQSHFIPCVTMF